MPAPEEELNLSTLKPAQKRKARKRVGRGMGSGKGRYSGRGIKGQKSRSGSHTMRPGFEGGQMPIYMRLGKKRGPYSKDAMPVGPHRTHTAAVNVRDLERVFDDGADVSLEALIEKGLIKNTRIDVKILGEGELKKKLAVTAHLFRMKPGQVSGIINSGFSLDIVKLLDRSGSSVHAAHIQFNFVPITTYTKPLQASQPVHDYIKVS